MNFKYSKEEEFLIRNDKILSKVITTNGHINFSNKKTFWVTLLSILMFLMSLVFFRLSDTSSKNLDYIPPQVIDGELNDGYFKEIDN